MTTGSVRLPEHLVGPRGGTLRRWKVADAIELQRVVTESAEHLRPWMAWMADEPLTLNDRKAMLRSSAGRRARPAALPRLIATSSARDPSTVRHRLYGR